MKFQYACELLCIIVISCNLPVVHSDNPAPKPGGDGPQSQGVPAATTPTKAAPTVKPDESKPKPTTDPTAQTATTASPTAASSPATQTAPTTKPTSVIEKFYKTLAADCSAAAKKCFANDPKFPDLKGKTVATVSCDVLDKGSKCFTDGKQKCSADDFEKIKKYACFCPRTAASVALVAILSVLSAMLGRQ